MKDFCKYVDVFYGNGEVDHFPEKGLASKWYYIKALCGNTTPHAVLPFGKMSVGAFSGGYPSGYGNHYPNSCGGIKKLSDGLTARGFSHLHQSGTGGIRYYYNYAVVTPFYGDLSGINTQHRLKDEKAHPGYYSVTLNDIFCELTVTHSVALHRYTFGGENGRIAIDFSNDGLSELFGDYYRGTVSEPQTEIDGRKVFFSGILSGIRLYFCAEILGDVKEISLFAEGKQFGAVADICGKKAELRLAYSTISKEKAAEQCNNCLCDFDAAATAAYSVWNEHLSKIDIEASEELKGRFYSNFYHSVIKPAYIGEESVMNVEGDLVTDLATLWDQYKTLYPLIFALYPQISEKLVNTIKKISESLNKIPCSFGLSTILPCEEQAKMLGIFLLLDAYSMGVKGVDLKTIEACINRELERDDFKSFIEKGVFERYTHILDSADACAAVAELTENKKLKEKLELLAKNIEKAYEADGLLSKKSPYYEGDRYTYSFRLHYDMKKRIELAGGKEKFIKLLDDFFGFNRKSLRQITDIGVDPAKVASHHRFEGFNNECDMETPYAYIYAGRNDRTCEIVHAAVNDSFTSGRGGLPGNNDSGGLSSCYIWNLLGLFPASSKSEFLIGSPHVKSAKIELSSGNTLEIEVVGQGYITERAELSGKELNNFILPTKALLSGGKLTFYMK